MASIYDDEEFFQEYAQMPRSKEGLDGAGEWDQLKKLFPDVRGKKVLDLGCGYGWHCAYAVSNGAQSVIGIDASEKMIYEAKKRNSNPKIQYVMCDINQYSYSEALFDCVISNLVLHYIADLDEVYRKVYRTLVPGGYFLMNIEHPVFTAGLHQEWVRDDRGKALYWPVDCYYMPGGRDTVFLGKHVTKQHHTLTQILGGLLNTGFQIRAVEEAVPPAKMMGLPGMDEEMRRPMMLLVKVQKA